MVFCVGWNISYLLLWLKGGECMIDVLMVQLSLAWVAVGLIAGWSIGFFMGCRKRGDYTK